MLRTIVIGIVLSLTSTHLYSSAISEKKTDHKSIKVVREYKALRSKCTIAQGEARKACFAQLEEKNASYRSAKKKLNANYKNDSVHVVSFSDQ